MMYGIWYMLDREKKREEGGFANMAEVYLLDFLDVVSDNLMVSVGALVVFIIALVFMCGGSGDGDGDDEVNREGMDDSPIAMREAAAKKKDDDAEVEEVEDKDEGEEGEDEEDEKPKGLRKRGKGKKTARAD
jgi:hypothetical protein